MVSFWSPSPLSKVRDDRIHYRITNKIKTGLCESARPRPVFFGACPPSLRLRGAKSPYSGGNRVLSRVHSSSSRRRSPTLLPAPSTALIPRNCNMSANSTTLSPTGRTTNRNSGTECILCSFCRPRRTSQAERSKTHAASAPKPNQPIREGSAVFFTS